MPNPFSRKKIVMAIEPPPGAAWILRGSGTLNVFFPGAPTEPSADTGRFRTRRPSITAATWHVPYGASVCSNPDARFPTTIEIMRLPKLGSRAQLVRIL